MKSILSRILLVGTLALTSCSSGHQSFHLPERTGPEFSVAFPDATLLLTTQDIEATRQQLLRVKLPKNQAHHESLSTALDSVTSLTSEHLILLTEAVDQTPETGTSSSTTTVSINGVNTSVMIHSSGPTAELIDGLLLSGLEKVNNPSPATLGRLLFRCQEKETRVELAQRIAQMASAAQWDDGSLADFKTTLNEIAIDSIEVQYCVDVLLPQNRMDQERFEYALHQLNFDSSRTQLLGADYGRRPHLDGETLLAHAKLMSFDSGRTDIVRLGAEFLNDVDGDLVLRLIKTASFDSGKLDLLKALAGHIQFRDHSNAVAIIRTASFDSGKNDIAEVLADDLANLSESQRTELLKCFSFDSGRKQVRETLGW